MVTELLDT